MDAIMKKYINNHQYKDDEDEYGVYEDTNDAGIYFSNIYHNSALKSLADNKIEERLDKYFEYQLLQHFRLSQHQNYYRVLY